MTALRKAFETFHRDNPRVYALLKRFAFQAIRTGREHIGVSLLWERIRWEVMIETQSKDEFKVNNNHRAYYARMFMLDHPEHAGFFRTRRVRGEIDDADFI